MIALVRETAQRLARMSDDPEPMPRAAGSIPNASSSLPARSATAARSAWNIAARGDELDRAGLPWREELVGMPESGILASGAIVSLIDTASGASVWMKLGHFRADRHARPEARLSAPGAEGRNGHRALRMREADPADRVRPRARAWRRSRHGRSPRAPATFMLSTARRPCRFCRSSALAQHFVGRLDLLEALRRLPCRPA